MTTGAHWEEQVRQLCRECIPPVLLANPTGWRLSQADEYSGEELQREAERQVARNAEAVVEWVVRQAPHHLKALLISVEENREALESCSAGLMALVTVTAARFISPRRQADRQYDILAWTQAERALWTSRENSELAARLLQRMYGSDGYGAYELPLPVIKTIFQAYLRPLFSATPSTNINDATGRARRNAPVASAGQAMEEDIMWKGGDIRRASATTVLDHLAAVSVPCKPPALQQRHAGLGCEGVLYVCCQSLRVAADTGAQDEDVWSQSWPDVLPPLLQMLEDPSPRYRLAASRILSVAILSEQSDKRAERQLSSLLRRTGVADLLFKSLAASLTFVSHRLAGPLLQSTGEAWIRLVAITTADNPADGGRAKFEQLSQLVDMGILRVWAYAPGNVTQEAMDDVGPRGSDAPDVEGEVEDVIDASIAILIEVAREEALGISIVRYIDVTLEYLTQQLIGLEVKVERLKAKEEPAHSTHRTSLNREIVAARAICALLKAAGDCPSLEEWSGRCLTSAARAWTVMWSAGRPSGGSWIQLEAELRNIKDGLLSACPSSTEISIDRLRKLDEPFFAPFIDP